MKRKGIWLVLLLLAVAGAFLLRMPELGRRPMHHDEANQATKCGVLQSTGYYAYDPVDHHGPTLYYLSLPFAWAVAGRDAAGTTEATLRIVPVLAGVGLVLLLALIVDGIGWPAALGAAILTAVSPAMVYFSRFYIQEMLLVLFTFGTIACGWRYWQKRTTGWAVAVGLSVGLMYATKETCVIAFAAMGMALCVIALRHRGEARAVCAAPQSRRHVAAALAAATLVAVVFYSSFFTHGRGVLDSVLTFRSYLYKAGDAGTHVHPATYYLKMLAFTRYGAAAPVWSEGLILILALAGCWGALTPRRSGLPGGGLMTFLVIYTVLMTAAYSLIPYKTPWCLISFLQGMIVLGGVGAVTIINRIRNMPAKVVVGLLLLAGCGHLGWQAHLATTRYAADERNPYVYSHTSTDFLKAVARIHALADVRAEGRSMLIAVVANPQDYWPLPWYLRGYSNVGYWSEPTALEKLPAPAVVIVATEPPGQIEAVASMLKADYQEEFYRIRPELFHNMFIRRDVWDAFMETRQ